MFEKFIEKYNLPRYRIDQINKQYYQEAIGSWDELTTWSKDLREKLEKEIPFSGLEDIQEFKSKDGRSIKILSQTSKGNPVESVLMFSKNGKRITVCVSCMSGCSVGCKFCATGQMGMKQLLSTQEILDQVMYFQRLLKKEKLKVTNVVYMGMGEPMLNLDSVLESINILTDESKVGLGRRRITVSTVGYIKQLRKFLEADTGAKLAISLHAPNQGLREQLMPTVAEDNTLEQLMSLLSEFVSDKNKRVTYEYILLKDVNDTEEHARELSELLEDKLALVNLINFNTSPNLPFESSTRERIDLFRDVLDENGINNTLRFSMGDEVQGACGQLSAKNS